MRKLFLMIALMIFFPGCLNQQPTPVRPQITKLNENTEEPFIKIIRKPGKTYIFFKKPEGERFSDEELKKINKELDEMSEADKKLLKRYIELKSTIPLVIPRRGLGA
tara:strand:- start:1962 stop:2282 length:321 start_codon:yes stop_codon:yes gene_type:complete